MHPSSSVITSGKMLLGISLVALFIALAGCKNSTRISTHAAGHEITVQIEGNHSLETLTDRAVITGEFGKITVERARVQLGDGPWNKIPEAVPMTVGILKHKSWVTAGGVSIKETSR